jgi:hypothetical protein
MPGSHAAVEAIDRPLIAFAFLAQTSSGDGDLLSRLAPIFKLIAKNRVGRRFDAAQFAKDVGKLYFIDVHPWAAEDLAPRLEKAGLLRKNQLSPGAYEYIYAEIDAEFSEVSEADIRLVVKKFIEFANPILGAHSIPVDEKALENGFFGQLIQMDFVSVLKKPVSDASTVGTLTLKKAGEEPEQSKGSGTRIDVLCASFIMHVYREERAIYDLLVRIASGALVAETVLNFQNPGGAVSLEKLTVVLDAPFLMSFLNLESEESHHYAQRICESLRKHGATLGAFKHSVEEIKDNLNGVINLSAEGRGFGATARRLSSPSFSAYATSVRANPEGAVAGVGIRIVTPPTSATAFAHLSGEDEDQIHATLGRYGNPLAQRRDAASIAAIVRLRFGKRTKMVTFQNAGYIFVTENPHLAERTHRFLVGAKLLANDEVPAAITDRYLAGLLLVLFGGQAAEFTQYRLLANCASALEAKNDVISKMHRFLVQIGQEEADRFRALMTVERAGQHLMQLTLGDSVFVTDSNAARILEDLERVLVDRERKAHDEHVRALQDDHQRQLVDAGKDKDNLERVAAEAQTQAMLAREAHRLADERLRALQQRFESTRAEALEKTRKRVLLAMRFASWCGTFTHQLVAITLAAVLGYLTYLAMEPSSAAAKILISLGVGVVGLVSFWKAPSVVFGPLVRRSRDAAFRVAATVLGLEDELGRFQISWDSRAVTVKDYEQGHS